MFANLKISAKLMVLVVGLLAAMLLVGGYGTYALVGQQQRAALALARERQLAVGVDAAAGTAVAFKVQVQEWKNILLRGHDARDYQNYVAAFGKQRAAVGKDLDRLQLAMAGLGLDTQPLEEARRLHADLNRQYDQALQRFDTARVETSHEVDALVRGKDRPVDEKLGQLIDLLDEVAEKERTALTTTMAQESQRGMVLMVSVMGVALLAGLVFGLWVARGISRPLRNAVGAARRVAEGDLTVQLQAHSRDEVGELLEALSQMARNLHAMASQVMAGAHAVADSSSQIAQGNLDLSQRTEEQASTLEETASQMEELTTTVAQNADTARQASQVASTAAQVASRGGEAVGNVVATMGSISESSRRISEIIAVVDAIAFQTNILALNAAVEAARAGEQGRGFAVVAAEVRNLAQRSASAAKEIKGLIAESVGRVDAGTRQVAAAGQTMDDIVASVRKVSELIAEIAAASQEQSAGIEQVNVAVAQMDQVVQQNAALVEEASAATEAMKSQAAGLLEAVSRFRLGGRAEQPATAPALAGLASRRALDGVDRVLLV